MAASLGLTRRQWLLAGVGALAGEGAAARTIGGGMPWQPNEAYPPRIVGPGPWLTFSAEEAATVEAIVDRIIPHDELSIGGKEAGCAVFIDRQLAGPYGTGEWWYMKGPIVQGTPEQGYQAQRTPVREYHEQLAELQAHCRASLGGRGFAQLSAEEQDRVLTAMDEGEAPHGDRGRAFVELLMTNTTEGFWADPIYGGNKDMAGWRLLGFPGARYDYRDVLDRPNQRYDRPPVALIGRPEWNVRRPA